MFNNPRFKKILDIILEINWLLIIGLTPVYFNIWTYSLWEVNGAILFYFLVEVLLIVWLIKLLLIQDAWSQIKKNRIICLKSIVPSFIFITIMGLSALFSESSYLSFFGLYKRQMGYLMWLHYFIFFLILLFNLKFKSQIKHICGTIIFSSIFVCLYGFLQIFGYDPIRWAEMPVFTKRIFSTLGQPNFLASWILLALPLVIYGFLIFRKKLCRYSALFMSIFLLIALFLTQSRAGWIGFIMGLIFFLLVLFKLKKKQIFFYSGLGAGLIFTLLIIYFNFSPLSYTNQPFLDRLISLTHFRQSGGIRLFWWQAALKEIKSLPLFGHGPETQVFHFVKYYQPEWAAYETINTYPDRLHNDFLDTLFTTGWPGLASYLFLISSAFCLGIKNIKKFFSQGFKAYGLWFMVLTGLLAYLISIQFCFHVIVTGVYFWLYLALINKTFLNQNEITDSN